MQEISDQVINKDVTLFEDDPIILQNVSFKLIWNADNTPSGIYFLSLESDKKIKTHKLMLMK